MVPFLLFHINSIFAQQIVAIGDTIQVETKTLEGCTTCKTTNISYTHQNGDFFVKFNGYYAQVSAEFYFVPTKIGLQRDTFSITITWAEHGNVTWDYGPYIISGSGVAKNSNVSFASNESFGITSLVNNQFINCFDNFSDPQFVHLKLFDALGRPQPLSISEMEIPAGENSQKLDIGNLPNGWYMLRIKTKDQVFNKSFLLIR